jgi:hypothetical protein
VGAAEQSGRTLVFYLPDLRDTYTFFSCKKSLLFKKAQFFQNCFEKFAFHGLDMEPEPEPDRNFSKV